MTGAKYCRESFFVSCGRDVELVRSDEDAIEIHLCEFFMGFI